MRTQEHSCTLFRANTYPGIFLPLKNPRLVAERGANVGPHAPLGGQCATGTAADGFAQMKTPSVGPSAAAGVPRGDVHARACTATRMSAQLGAWGCAPFRSIPCPLFALSHPSAWERGSAFVPFFATFPGPTYSYTLPLNYFRAE